MPAKRTDWKTTPLPEARKRLEMDHVFASDAFKRIREGRVPEVMEDKWFIFYEEPWLYLHRSWTGICVFQVRFEEVSGGHRIVEVLVNRDPAQYGSTDDAQDRRMLQGLLGMGWRN